MATPWVGKSGYTTRPRKKNEQSVYFHPDGTVQMFLKGIN
jgi:hypothetical protein